MTESYLAVEKSSMFTELGFRDAVVLTISQSLAHCIISCKYRPRAAANVCLVYLFGVLKTMISICLV